MMGRFIIKITDPKEQKDYYMEWSTIVDAPVTYGMEIGEFKEYYRQEYGEYGMGKLQERLDRVAVNGCSGLPPYDNVDDLISCNRAGANERKITKAGILKKYCRNWTR